VDSREVVFWAFAALLVSGCISLRPQEENVTIMDVDELRPRPVPTSTTSTTTTAALGPTSTSTTLECPYQCCNDTEHRPRACGGWLTCLNGTCVDRPCPFQCCVLGMYETKECPGPLACVNSTCVRLPCPEEFECCNGTDYLEVECRHGFVCMDHRCNSVDSDSDGLADVAEKNYGTNENLPDTDGDGLLDHLEVKTLGTNPLSKNTDSDRYPDGNDSRPAVKDSAFVNVTLVANSVDVNPEVLDKLVMHLDFGQPLPAALTEVARFHFQTRLDNTGSDYTDFVNYTYQIGYWCAPGVDVRRKPFVIGQITNVNQSWVGLRGEHNDTENATAWVLKDVKVAYLRRLNPQDRIITAHSASVTVADLSEEAMAAVVSTRRCAYNTGILNARYETF